MRNTEATLAKGRFRTDVFKSSFFNRIVNLWNGLPVAIRTIDRVSLFSKKVNQFYISKFNLKAQFHPHALRAFIIYCLEMTTPFLIGCYQVMEFP